MLERWTHRVVNDGCGYWDIWDQEDPDGEWVRYEDTKQDEDAALAAYEANLGPGLTNRELIRLVLKAARQD